MYQLSKILLTLCSSLFYIALSASPLATFNYKRFYSPEKGHYIETYFDIAASSIALDETGKGKIELILIFKQGDNIITFDKKILESPDMDEVERVDFLDIQRFALAPGKYELEISLKDMLNAEDQGYTTIEMIEIPTGSAAVFISDIELISAYRLSVTQTEFTKSGYDLLPMVSDDYFNPNMNEIVLYFEVYNTQTFASDTSVFLAKAYLKNQANNVIEPSTAKYFRRNAAEVVPILTTIPITDLPTGRFNLVVEIRSKTNELLAEQAIEVMRTAPVKQLDPAEINAAIIATSWVSKYDSKPVLFEHVHSTRPLARDKELYYLSNNLSEYENCDLVALQGYMYAFWQSRSEMNSEAEWNQYRAQVEYVQGKYGTLNKKGYQTDRGRVFLKYGPPNDITNRAAEPSSYPYEIWRYYKSDIYNNVKFVFYDPSLLNIDYELLHCEYIPGERRTPQWKLILESRNTPMNNVDRQEGLPHYGGRVDDFYNNPR